jgi:hypothetical protein
MTSVAESAVGKSRYHMPVLGHQPLDVLDAETTSGSSENMNPRPPPGSTFAKAHRPPNFHCTARAALGSELLATTCARSDDIDHEQAYGFGAHPRGGSAMSSLGLETQHSIPSPLEQSSASRALERVARRCNCAVHHGQH